jgi:hypothetical protein
VCNAPVLRDAEQSGLLVFFNLTFTHPAQPPQKPPKKRDHSIAHS